MTTIHTDEIIETTLDDLVVAVNDAVAELSGNKTAAYLLAGLVLEQILKKAPLKGNGDPVEIDACDEPVFH